LQSSKDQLALLPGSFLAIALHYRNVTIPWPDRPPITRSGRPHMYIDPTTGSLVLQFLAAGVLSVVAMASRVREAVKSFFKMLLPRKRR
jgi:hypothetical protein